MVSIQGFAQKNGENLIGKWQAEDNTVLEIFKSENAFFVKQLIASKEKEKNNPKAYGKIDFDVTDLPRGTYYLNMGFENKNGNKVEQTRIILTDK